MATRGPEGEEGSGAPLEFDVQANEPPPIDYDTIVDSPGDALLAENTELRDRLEASKVHYRSMRDRAKAAEASALKVGMENDRLRRIIESLRPKEKRFEIKHCPVCRTEVRLDDDDAALLREMMNTSHNVRDIEPCEIQGIFITVRCEKGHR